MENIFHFSISLCISLTFFSCSPVQQIQQIQQEIKAPSDWSVIHKSELELKKYFDNNRDNLDPIEGIWNYQESGTWRNVYSGINGEIPQTMPYRLGIFRDTTNKSYEFIAIILESEFDFWKPGFIKAKFRNTAYPKIYEGLWYMSNFSNKKDTYIMDENGLIKTRMTQYDPNNNYIEYTIEGLLIKAYPQLNSKVFSSNDVSLKATGSGFLISTNGLVVTNYHVVENANRIEIVFPEKSQKLSATIKIKDSKNDIAILEISDFSYSSYFSQQIPFVLADINILKVGEEVFTLGFPLGEMLGSKSRMSSGRINSTFGIQDDPRLLQISNPLQPGNSGGPLFNSKGELVGIVVASLNAKYFYDNIGVIPQNVNFAIKSTYLQNLLSMLPESDEILKRKNLIISNKMEEQIEQLNPFIIQIRAY